MYFWPFDSPERKVTSNNELDEGLVNMLYQQGPRESRGCVGFLDLDDKLASLFDLDIMLGLKMAACCSCINTTVARAILAVPSKMFSDMFGLLTLRRSRMLPCCDSSLLTTFATRGLDTRVFD